MHNKYLLKEGREGGRKERYKGAITTYVWVVLLCEWRPLELCAY